MLRTERHQPSTIALIALSLGEGLVCPLGFMLRNPRRSMLEILSVFFGPIFAKELVEMSRRWRYYLGRVIYGSALLITLVAVALDRRRIWSGTDLSIRETAALAYEIFMAVSILQYAAVYVFVPIFLCGVVAGEREEHTLELLFTTHLTNRQIILSKLLSRLFVVTLLILSALPVFSLITLFGGVDLMQVLMNTGATLLALLLVGSLSIYMSTTTRSPLGALVRTYACLLIWLVVVPMVILFIGELLFRRGGMVSVSPAIVLLEEVLPLLHPVAVFVLGMNPRLFSQVVTATGTVWIYPAGYVLPCFISLLLLWRASRRLRIEPKTFRQRLSWLGAPRRWLRRWTRATSVRPVATRRASGKPVSNPFWQRARVARIFDREGYIGWIQWAGWIAAGLFFVLFLVVNGRTLRNDETSLVFIVPTLIGLMSLVILVASSSIIGDRRRGFFELVLTTPVTPSEVVDGTLLAVWQHLRPAFWLAVALEVVFVLAGAAYWQGAVASLISVVLFTTLLALVGIGCSLAARTYVGALTPTCLYVLALMMGLFMMVGIFQKASGPALWILTVILGIISVLAVRRTTNPVAVGLLFLSSYLALLSVTSCWSWAWDWRHEEYPIALMHPGFLALRPLDGKAGRWFHDIPWPLVYVFFWTGLIANILFVRWWLVRNFNRLVGRSTGQRTDSTIFSPPLKGGGGGVLMGADVYSKT